MNFEVILIAGLCASCVGGITWYAAQVAQQVSYVTLADGRQQERRLPLLFRLLLPFTPNFSSMLKHPDLQSTRDRVNAQLISGGFDGLLRAEEFLALRVLTPLVFGILGSLLVYLLLALPKLRGVQVSMQQPLLFSLMLILFLAMYPGMWLKRSIAQRHLTMQKALPFVLDLLTLSVEAGMDFMSAIQRIIDHRAMDPIGEELLRVLHEIQLGKPRREALRDMATRVDQPDVRSVFFAMVQADELGVGIGSILRIQSDQLRNKRFERAEKKANEAPVKMLFPLLGFILPAVFVILLGPILSQVFNRF